jgi:hypothetical protein
MTTRDEDMRRVVDDACRRTANRTCRRVGCERPSTWAPVVSIFLVGCDHDEPDIRVGSTLGFCAECRLYVVEAVIPKVAHDAAEWMASRGFPVDRSRTSWEFLDLEVNDVKR